MSYVKNGWMLQKEDKGYSLMASFYTVVVFALLAKTVGNPKPPPSLPSLTECYSRISEAWVMVSLLCSSQHRKTELFGLVLGCLVFGYIHQLHKMLVENQCFWTRLRGNVRSRYWIRRRKLVLDSEAPPMLFHGGTMFWPLCNGSSPSPEV